MNNNSNNSFESPLKKPKFVNIMNINDYKQADDQISKLGGGFQVGMKKPLTQHVFRNGFGQNGQVINQNAQNLGHNGQNAQIGQVFGNNRFIL